MKCGREPDRNNITELGTCTAATDNFLNGINFGTNGGRICWALVGTICAGEVQGTFAKKFASSRDCEFHKLIWKFKMAPLFSYPTLYLVITSILTRCAA